MPIYIDKRQQMYIQFNNIKKSFDGNTVLDVENLQIEKGEIVSIIGKNGFGGIQIFKSNILLSIFLSFVFMYGIFLLFMDLALIYERISTFTGFITTAFLIFGYKLTIVQEVKNIIVEGPFDLKKVVFNAIFDSVSDNGF